jgi:hypothetical protein
VPTPAVIEAGAAVGALVMAVWGTTTHYVARYLDHRRSWNRVEDAIFGYEGEPGILKRLAQLEQQGRTK